MYYKIDEVGQRVEWASQVFVCVGLLPHIRQDGTDTRLAEMQSGCHVCGEAFTFKVPALASRFQPTRHCALHRRSPRNLSKRFWNSPRKFV